MKALTATASAVHTPSADSKSPRKKGARSFGTMIVDPDPDPAALQKRELKAHSEGTAKTPFMYDVNALGDLRPDQVPRFLGALTDQDQLPTETVDLKDLVAMQDRVDPAKVEAQSKVAGTLKRPVVVQANGKKLIADGHHRLAGQWLRGDTTADVAFKDLEPVSQALKRSPDAPLKIAKIDPKLGLVFGWAVICKIDGEPYFDRNVDFAGKHKGKRVPEHVTEDAMLKASVEFMDGERAGNELHEGPDSGHYVFVFPMTSDIAKAMGIETKKTGMMVAYKPTPDVLKKFESGEYTGFSIEGKRIHFEERT